MMRSFFSVGFKYELTICLSCPFFGIGSVSKVSVISFFFFFLPLPPSPDENQNRLVFKTARKGIWFHNFTMHGFLILPLLFFFLLGRVQR